MYDPCEPHNSYQGNDPFLSDSFDDLNTTYNSQDPLFPGESNQPPMGSTNILAPRKKWQRSNCGSHRRRKLTSSSHRGWRSSFCLI